MAQRIFIKVIGFSDEERHALNTLFRLSEQCLTMYQLWTPQAPEPPRLALLDGNSHEARVEAESPLADPAVKLLWVGSHPPPQAWRAVARPLSWPEVIEAMDILFQPVIDLDLVEPQSMSGKQALIVGAGRDERLYLRARLALARVTQADEAESGARALELARNRQYDLALVGFGLPDIGPWALLRQLREGRHPIPHVAMTKPGRSLAERLRAWAGGAGAMLDQPPHPERFDAFLRRV